MTATHAYMIRAFTLAALMLLLASCTYEGTPTDPRQTSLEPPRARIQHHDPSSIELSWPPVPGAIGYEIYSRRIGGDWPNSPSTLRAHQLPPPGEDIVFQLRCSREGGEVEFRLRSLGEKVHSVLSGVYRSQCSDEKSPERTDWLSLRWLDPETLHIEWRMPESWDQENGARWLEIRERSGSTLPRVDLRGSLRFATLVQAHVRGPTPLYEFFAEVRTLDPAGNASDWYEPDDIVRTRPLVTGVRASIEVGSACDPTNRSIPRLPALWGTRGVFARLFEPTCQYTVGWVDHDRLRGLCQAQEDVEFTAELAGYPNSEAILLWNDIHDRGRIVRHGLDGCTQADSFEVDFRGPSLDSPVPVNTFQLPGQVIFVGRQDILDGILRPHRWFIEDQRWQWREIDLSDALQEVGLVAASARTHWRWMEFRHDGIDLLVRGPAIGAASHEDPVVALLQLDQNDQLQHGVVLRDVVWVDQSTPARFSRETRWDVLFEGAKSANNVTIAGGWGVWTGHQLYHLKVDDNFLGFWRSWGGHTSARLHSANWEQGRLVVRDHGRG